MKNRIIKTLLAATLITSIVSTSVFADEVSDLKKKQQQQQAEYDQFEDDLAYLFIQIEEIDRQSAEAAERMEAVNNELQELQVKQDKQYADMKLRIKFMYEDQGTSFAEAILTSKDMSDALNKAEYVQKVYDYDRDQLDALIATAQEINNKKEDISNLQTFLASKEEELNSKQALLVVTLNEKKQELDKYPQLIADAQARAYKASASTSSNVKQIVARNDLSTAQKVIEIAKSKLGCAYVYGAIGPNNFDCSGLTSYCFSQVGLGIPRSSSAQRYGGTNIGTNLADAKPGDIICFPGHVGLYVGNDTMIHSPHTGDVVKYSKVSSFSPRYTAIVRYW